MVCNSLITNNLGNIKTQRSGIIPFTIMNKSIYFLLGIDNVSKELTDFGGGVKKTENAITGAFREFQEETNNIFENKISIGMCKSSVAITDENKMTIIFLKIYLNFFEKENVLKTFQKNKPFCQEIDQLVWMHEQNFRNIIKYNTGNLMWKRIQRFLLPHNNQEFYKMLQNI